MVRRIGLRFHFLFHVLRRTRPRCHMRKADERRPQASPRGPGGKPAAPGACKGRMMHRGLTLRENGATAICPPSRQQSWPRFLPSQSSRLCISGVRILRLRGASTKRRPVPALCAVPACFRHVWRLLSARGSGTWRRTLLIMLCLQNGGTGTRRCLLLGSRVRERMAASRE